VTRLRVALARTTYRGARACSSMYVMEIPAREFDQKSSRILAAAARGESVTVTRNGIPVARVVPVNDTGVPPYPTDAMGDLDLPDLGLPDLTDDEIEDVLTGRGA
jgi:prevent-host-death family protein